LLLTEKTTQMGDENWNYWSKSIIGRLSLHVTLVIPSY